MCGYRGTDSSSDWRSGQAVNEQDGKSAHRDVTRGRERVGTV